MKMAILMDARAAALMGKKPPQRKLPARLPCIVHALCGSSITVELRNSTIIEGTLDTIDYQNNLTLENASFHHPFKGTAFTAAPILFVNGAHIRSITLPSNITVRSVVAKWTKDSRKQLAQKSLQK